MTYASRSTTDRFVIHADIEGTTLVLETAPGLFSPRKIDAGTAAMLSCVEFSEDDKVLDLGCGYGVVGIYAARRIDPSRIYLLDNDAAAVALARRNADQNEVTGVHVLVGDGFNGFSEAGFTLILCNPPYHSDFSLAKHFIQKGFNRLKIGGKLWMVTKREPWYRKKLRSIFGDVKLHRAGSYTVFEATKHSPRYAKAKRT